MSDIPNQSKSDTELIKFHEELFQTSKQFMTPYHDEWEKNWRYFDGDQWYDCKRPRGLAMEQANLMYSLITQSVAHMTSAKPTVRALPLIRDEETVEVAELFNLLIPAVWDELHITNTLKELL